MCRAIWVVVVAPSEEACKRIRRAAGADVQVVAIVGSVADLDGLAETPADVVVIQGMPDAVEAARARWPDAAIVWVGEAAPEGLHAVGPDGLEDALPGAINAALIARRR